MGTNYYLHAEGRCPTCGHLKDTLHIGKSSAGWCFALQRTEELPTLSAWIAKWQSGKIKDEYGKEISPGEMVQIIAGRSWSRGHTLDYAANNAVPGPNGLARHAISSSCNGHGEGTWDYMIGDFS